MKKFKRAGHGASRKDLKGDVVIKFILYKNSIGVKGNIVKTIRVADAKVSEVYSTVERLLF